MCGTVEQFNEPATKTSMRTTWFVYLERHNKFAAFLAGEVDIPKLPLAERPPNLKIRQLEPLLARSRACTATEGRVYMGLACMLALGGAPLCTCEPHQTRTLQRLWRLK
jgi:hypothetical protein